MSSWRSAAVTMTAALGGWLSAWAITDAVRLGPDVVVLTVMLVVTLGRSPGRAHGPWWARLVALPLVALAASEVARLIAERPDLGDALFVLVLAGAVWLRRFGPLGRALGGLVAMPFIALLVAPIPVRPGTALSWWPAVFALLAMGWLVGVRWAARRTGFSGPPPPTPLPLSRGRRQASTRMAVQLAVALAAGFVFGRWLFPSHWPWVVISAYVVCSGTRGRGDVVHKGLLRIAGAVIGTAVATLIAGLFPAGDRTALVLLFVVMGLAVWLRTRSYAYWAGGVTAMLALLHGYYGQTGVEQLYQRVLGVLLGSVLAIAVSWFVLPVRSHDVFRRRWSEAMRALSEHLRAMQGEGDLEETRAWLEASGRNLEQIEPGLRLHRLALDHLDQDVTAHPADLVVLFRRVRHGLVALPQVEYAEQRRVISHWSDKVAALRRRMRTDPVSAVPPAPYVLPGRWEQAAEAIDDLDRAFTREAWQHLGGR